MRICVVKATGKLIEMQSAATKGTLIKNAIAAGYSDADIEEREITEAEWADPSALWNKPTTEQLRAAEIASLKAYLASTDWYVARFAETGTAIPDDVKAARAAARARIDELRVNE